MDISYIMTKEEMDNSNIDITGETACHTLICEGNGLVYIATAVDENNYKINSIHKIK